MTLETIITAPELAKLSGYSQENIRRLAPEMIAAGVARKAGKITLFDETQSLQWLNNRPETRGRKSKEEIMKEYLEKYHNQAVKSALEAIENNKPLVFSQMFGRMTAFEETAKEFKIDLNFEFFEENREKFINFMKHMKGE